MSIYKPDTDKLMISAVDGRTLVMAAIDDQDVFIITTPDAQELSEKFNKGGIELDMLRYEENPEPLEKFKSSIQRIN